MELELQKEHITAYQMRSTVCDTHEEMSETIVPDYCPDIARIVDAYGELSLKDQEAFDGKGEIAGSVRVSVLYIGEDSPQLRSLVYTLPFSYRCEGEGGKNDTSLHLTGEVTACEVRLLNPRKLSTHLTLTIAATPYQKVTVPNCSGITQQQEYGIETLCEMRHYRLIKALARKEFTVSEEVMLSGSKKGIAEMLSVQSFCRVTECKAISNKLILKGVITIEGLYRDEDGALSRLHSESPFSQIADGMEDDGKDVSCECAMRLNGTEYRIGSDSAPDDRRTLSVQWALCAFATLQQEEDICCISDFYSTDYDLRAETQSIALTQAAEMLERTQNVRLTVECGSEVSEILETAVDFSACDVVGGADGADLRATASVRVLYLDENQTPLSVTRRAEVSLRTVLPSASQVSVVRVTAIDASAAPIGGGIEVRFPAVFTLAATDAPCYSCLLTLEAEPLQEAKEPLPSLRLKRLAPNQRLWDIAKQYHTTVKEIVEANELLEETAAAVGQMLLIPRRR